MAFRVKNFLLIKNIIINETQRKISIYKNLNQTIRQQIIPIVSSNSSLPIDKEKPKSEKLNRAMLAFLKRAEAYEKVIKEKEAEYELGRKHLAKMMGYDPYNDKFDQDDIDKAVEYLLPSGLFQKKARPFLKHPTSYYPKIKELQFDKEGRPLHCFFYTSFPKYFDLISTITEKIFKLDKMLDEISNTDLTLTKYDVKGSKWIDEKKFTKSIDEKITDTDYVRFINVMERLMNHPLSKTEEEFINNYREIILPSINKDFKKELNYLEDGRAYAEMTTVQRTATVSVKLIQGTGEIEIDSPEGKFDILYFSELKHREQLLFPFKITNTINKFDIKMTFNNGGMSCLAKAARFGISNLLCNFINETDIEKLRISGLLTFDKRMKERKKPGQKGARRRYTWKKR